MIKILELCNKYILQIVSALSKLTDKLNYFITCYSWYVSNSFLFFYM